MSKPRIVIEDVYDEKAKKTYVYETEVYYDPAIKNTRRRRKMLGHRDPETGELKPNRPIKNKKKASPQNNSETILNEAKKITRRFYGATYFLHGIARKIGLEKDLAQVFPEDYQSMLQLAYYLVLSPSNAMCHFESWQKKHYLPYNNSETLTSQRISDIFSRVTEHEKQEFFNLRMKALKPKEYIYYDTTSISSYSSLLPYVKYGYNKEDDKLPQINLGVLQGEQCELPVMYRHLAGNVQDSKTIKWLLGMLDHIECDRIKLVMDRGFYSEENVYALINDSIGFVMGVRKNLNYIKAAIQESKKVISRMSNYSTIYKISGTRIGVDYFKPANKQSHYPMQAYIYFNTEIAVEEEKNFNNQIHAIYEKLNKGEVILKELGKTQAKYFTKVETSQGVKFGFNEEVIEEEKSYFGYIVLLSTFKKDPWEILRLYRSKNMIEETFHNLKERLNMRRLRVSSERSLEGKIFIQFIALIIQSYIQREMDRSRLRENYTQKEILDTFQAIEYLSHPTYGTTMGEVSVKQRELFIKMGITPVG